MYWLPFCLEELKVAYSVNKIAMIKNTEDHILKSQLGLPIYLKKLNESNAVLNITVFICCLKIEGGTIVPYSTSTVCVFLSGKPDEK